MANTWGELTWNVGLWGEQSNAIATLTGFGLTTTQGQANYTPADGWGRNTWGALGWGVNFANNNFTASGYSLNLIEGDVVVSGEINEGWGRLTWGENAWGGTGDVIVEGLQLNTSLNSVGFSITAEVPVTGLQLVALSPVITTSNLQNVSGTSDNILFTFRPGASSKVQYVGLGWNVVGQPTFIVTSVTLDPNDQYTGTITITGGTFVSGQSYQFESPNIQAFGLAEVFPIGQQLNISEGEVDIAPDANVTGQQLNVSLGSPLSYNNEGWGRYVWGEEVWGGNGIWVFVPVTGQQLNLSLNSVTPLANANVDVTGQQLNVSEGIVDPSPDATVTGIGITIGLAIGTVVIGTGNVALTGQQINISQGTVEAIPNTIASVTGIGLNIGVGTVFAGGTSIIIPTGNGLTIALNSINNQIWTEVNTGTDATWTEIDTAA
jgi:hypothetical protein